MSRGVYGSTPEISCQICGITFKQSRKTRRFCSRKCVDINRSRTTKGIPHSKEHCENIAKSLLGKKHTEQRKENISKGRTGKMMGPSHHFWNHDREEVKARKNASKGYRSTLRHVLTCLKIIKKDFTSEILGYSVLDFRKHMEQLFVSGMSWENYGYGKGKWNIDHIRPVSKWPLNSHPRDVNALKNLRPMWHEENIKRGNRWNPNE